MDERIKQVIIDFERGNVTRDKLISEVFGTLEEKSNEIRKIIENVIYSRNKNDLELSLTLIWEFETNNEFTDLIHKLLLETWHTKYEDLIHELQSREDNLSVQVITQAIQQQYDYLESYDTGVGQFISQCGYALFSIGTEDAILSIHDLSKSDNEIIKREMNYQLKRLDEDPNIENTELTPRWWT